MKLRLLNCVVLVALWLPLGACARGLPDPTQWRLTSQFCLPGFHAVPSPTDWNGYRCAPNSN